MSSYTFLWVYDDQKTVFDDLNAMNAELQAAGIGELTDCCQRDPNYVGFFKYEGTQLSMALLDEGNFDGDYTTRTSVYGLFRDTEAQIVANHIIRGKLVLMLDAEGEPNQYYVLSPNKMKFVEKVLF